MSGSLPTTFATFVNDGEEIPQKPPHGDNNNLHLWNGLPGDDGALVTDQTKCSTRCPTTPPWRGSCGWVHNKTNEMDKVFTLSGECSAIQHYVTFPDVLDWLLKCGFDY